jgi:hypothetical protein
MKTVEEWFNDLEEPYKTQALENSIEKSLKIIAESMSEALSSGFYWTDSPQGHEYWYNIFKKHSKLS